MTSAVRADIIRACNPGMRYQDAPPWSWRKLARILGQQGIWAVLEYRWRRWIRGLPSPWRSLVLPLGLMTHKLTETLTGISISPRAEFGPGLRINHFGGIIVGPGVVAGENCSLSQDVTLGDHRGSPRMGACIYVAPGAKVFGAIVVGDHVAIGANAVVNEDVPSYSTAVAGHARILSGRGNLLGPNELAVTEEPHLPLIGSD
jgi:serine O-acetyltransferase